jgi:thioredoxin reductase
MNTQLDVAIIGAGPYGLSVAAYLEAAGVEHRVFGVPMESWSNNMPPGMCLKSLGLSSSLYDPQSNFTLADFSRENGISYDPVNVPVKLENFISYGRAFQERFVPDVTQQRLVELCATDFGHELNFDNGETVTAQHVVLATGVVPFKYTPSGMAHLPAALLSHSGDFGPLDRLKGKAVTVLGSGSSALDIAALASMQGGTVTLIARSSKLEFQPAPVRRNQSLIGRVLRRAYAPPSHGIGDGWGMLICADAPQFIHGLPDRWRAAILNNTLGPSGGYFIRDQIEQHVTLKLGRSIQQIDERNGGVQLTTVDRDGVRETLQSDHVVAATGYRVDLRQLAFLSAETLKRIRMVEHTPILSANFESSVPGLHFVGLAAARSFGPVLRFVMGAVHPARRLAQFLPRSLLRRSISMPAAISN